MHGVQFTTGLGYLLFSSEVQEAVQNCMGIVLIKLCRKNDIPMDDTIVKAIGVLQHLSITASYPVAI